MVHQRSGRCISGTPPTEVLDLPPQILNLHQDVVQAGVRWTQDLVSVFQAQPATTFSPLKLEGTQHGRAETAVPTFLHFRVCAIILDYCIGIEVLPAVVPTYLHT